MSSAQADPGDGDAGADELGRGDGPRGPGPGFWPTAPPLDLDRRQRLEPLPAVRLRAPRLVAPAGAVAPSPRPPRRSAAAMPDSRRRGGRGEGRTSRRRRQARGWMPVPGGLCGRCPKRLDAGSGSKRPDDRACAPAPALRVAFLVTRDDLQAEVAALEAPARFDEGDAKRCGAPEFLPAVRSPCNRNLALRVRPKVQSRPRQVAPLRRTLAGQRPSELDRQPPLPAFDFERCDCRSGRGPCAVRPRESQVRPQGPSRRRRPADAQASGRPVLALDAVAPRPVALRMPWAGQARTILHGRGGNGRRTVRPRPAQQSPTRRRQPWPGRRARQERLRRVRRPCSWMASVVGDLGFEVDGLDGRLPGPERVVGERHRHRRREVPMGIGLRPGCESTG